MTDYGLRYTLNIKSNDHDQYNIYFPFQVKDLRYSEVFKNASLIGNGTYSVVNTEQGDTQLIKGRGDLVFEVNHRSKSKISNPFPGPTEVYFQGNNGSVSIRIDGSVSESVGSYMTFYIRDIMLVEGWQKINVESMRVILD